MIRTIKKYWKRLILPTPREAKIMGRSWTFLSAICVSISATEAVQNKTIVIGMAVVSGVAAFYNGIQVDKDEQDGSDGI
jgi:hypothetical protein